MSNGIQYGGLYKYSYAKTDTTLNIYTHAIRETKSTSARLLDKVSGGE